MATWLFLPRKAAAGYNVFSPNLTTGKTGTLNLSNVTI